MATQSTYTVRTAPGSTVIDLSGLGDYPHSIAVQEDGKILVAGYSQYVAYGYVGSPQDYYQAYENYSLIRLNADGTLDTSFANGGVAIIDAQVDEDRGNAITVQPDGKIIVSTDNQVIQRFNVDGTLDTTFGAGTGKVKMDSPGSFNSAPSVTVNDDGTLYVTTLTGPGYETPTVTKLNADGSIATDYGDNGSRAFSATQFEGIYATSLVLADGSVLFGGDWSSDNGYAYSLVHVNADGTLDTGFGENGKLVFDKAVGLDGYSMYAVQPDGKIIVVGSGDADSGVVLRLNTDGSLDTSFGDNGYATFAAAVGGLVNNDADAVTVLADGKILISGYSNVTGADFGVIRLNADGSLDTSFGSQDGKYHVDGYTGQDTLVGTDLAEIIHGLAGDDVLQGGGGRDVLYGGSGADIFRFTAVEDSYRTASTNNSDRIQDFDPTQDRIDLTSLGFTGLGNGLDGTLAVQVNAEGTRTYLKSFETDADGQRFELAIDGNWLGQLNTSNVVFTPAPIEGTAGADVIKGTAIAELIQGLAGNDRIDGGAGDDVLQGGTGRDVLYGGAGADTYLYTAVTDSYRTATESFSDVIVDLDGRVDQIDVSALGYTGFGDGTDHTLKLSYNSELDRSYLKDMEADAQGHRFEISLTGDWRGGNLNDNVIFATAVPATEVELVGVSQAENHTVA